AAGHPEPARRLRPERRKPRPRGPRRGPPHPPRRGAWPDRRIRLRQVPDLLLRARPAPHRGRVVSGSIHFEGVDLVAGSSREHGAVRGKKIAYIPQEPMSNLDPMFTIGSQLTEPLRRTLGMSGKEARQ